MMSLCDSVTIEILLPSFDHINCGWRVSEEKKALNFGSIITLLRISAT